MPRKHAWPDPKTVENDEHFAAFLRWMPPDWQLQAETLGAFQRARKIKTPATLLRLVLAYVVLRKSLPDLSRWAAQQSIVEMAFPSLWERFAACLPFLRWLVAKLCTQVVSGLPSKLVWCPVDGTSFSLPASTKRDWLILLLWSRGQPLGVRITKLGGKNTGESLRHLDCLPPQAVAIGDRAFGTPPGLGTMHDRGRRYLVRFVWNNLPLYASPEGNTRVDPRPMLKGLAPGTCREFTAWVRPAGMAPLAVRVVAVAKTPEKAEAARRASAKESRRKGHKPDPFNLWMCGFVTLVTNLSPEEADTATLAEAYRWRWQIELEFKRLKSIAQVRSLPNQKDETVEFYLLAMMAVWLLCHRMLRESAFFPWGCPLGHAC